MTPTLDWWANTPAGAELGQQAAQTLTINVTPWPWWFFPIEPWHWFFRIVGTSSHSFFQFAFFLSLSLLLAILGSRRLSWKASVGLGLTCLLSLTGGTQAMAWVTSVVPHGPTWVVPDGAPYRLADLHTHTQATGGALLPEDVVRWHWERGYTVVAITDSNKTHGVARAQEYARRQGLPMVVMGGEEYRGTTHVLMLGLETPIRSDLVPLPQAIAQARAQGALVLAAHAWTGEHSPEQLVDYGVEGFEVVNRRTLASPEVLRICRSRGLMMVGNSDFRDGRWPCAATIVPAWADTPARVAQALRDGQCAALYCPDWSEPSAFSPWVDLSRTLPELYHDGKALVLPGLLFWLALGWWGGPALHRRLKPVRHPTRALVGLVLLAAASQGLGLWSVWWKLKWGWFPSRELATVTWAVACPACWILSLRLAAGDAHPR